MAERLDLVGLLQSDGSDTFQNGFSVGCRLGHLADLLAIVVSNSITFYVLHAGGDALWKDAPRIRLRSGT